MERWINIATAAKWKTLVEIRQAYNSADVVNDKYVFNIGGNKYRLLTRIEFQLEEIFVLMALTHVEYDQIKL